MRGAPEPRELGRYQLTERLAVGGMAELYRARMTGAHDFAKSVVIKKILPNLSADEEFVTMFIDEAKLTAQLVHPKIVQVFELGLQRNELFIAMEFIDGIDVLALLRDFARRGAKIPAAVAVHVIHEVLDALDYAHNACDEQGVPLGIVHRDVTPGNILVSVRGDVKITDFGIARAVVNQAQTMAGTLKGKYGYMSPEQVQNGPLDGRSDVFACGVVLSEMLMGRRLFLAQSDLDVLLMVRDVNLSRLDSFGKNIDPALRKLIEISLAREPSERFMTARSFRDALSDWVFQTRRRVGQNEIAAIVMDVRSRIGKGETVPPPAAAGTDPSASSPVLAADRAIRDSVIEFTMVDTHLPQMHQPDLTGETFASEEPPTMGPDDQLSFNTTGTGSITTPHGVAPWATGDPNTMTLPPDRITELLGGAMPSESSRLHQPHTTDNHTLSDEIFVRETRFNLQQEGDDHADEPSTRTLSKKQLDGLVSASGDADNAEQTRDLPAMQMAGLIGQSRVERPDDPFHLDDVQLESDVDPHEEVNTQIEAEEPSTGVVQKARRQRLSEPGADEEMEDVPARDPDARGKFEDTAALHVMYRLGASRATGLLEVSLGTIHKSLYFVEGTPRVVHSNVGSERLGEFLVHREVISQGELSMALAVSPQFGGRFGDVLIALGLLDEKGSARALGDQLRAKVLDVCTWEKGKYAWYNGETSRNPAERADFDLWSTMGASCLEITADHARVWGSQHRQAVMKPKKNAHVPIESFQLGTRVTEILKLMDGKRTLEQISELFTEERMWLDAVRTILLLVQCEHVELWR